MTRRSLTIEEVLTLLPQAPEHIAEITDGLTPAQLRTAPEPDEWSITEILAHLRTCADVWGGCVVTILAEDHPTIRAINPRSWIKRTDYPDLEFQPSFQVFTTQRAELLAILESLLPEAWTRAATVTGAGKPLQRTVLSYASWLARHERSHYRQFQRTADAVRA